MAKRRITAKPKPKQSQIRLNLSSASVDYISEFSIQSTSEELFFNFAASLFPGNAPNEIVLPVHTRLAVNYKNAKRFHDVLSKVLKKYERQYGEIDISNIQQELPIEEKEKNVTTATLPKVKL
ncbi:DUF3467 domain-containing protein [Candidatus Uabimicrobium sp. HlEnr_7]|uniref:DUF3467 domain-containing protein n=1 Tax=Candidatus Uabimicrobium helgolandensis TaxID=3095367 RepID=UPI00355833B3